MTKHNLGWLYFLLFGYVGFAQHIDFEEYKLDNDLHVILHQDNSVPVVAVGVMYHVGAKDEKPGKSGFAHFFKHLLFEGSKNIERGEWFKLVSSHGGSNNAYTTQDATYYYETFPSNHLELGLWMESERMLHPKIGQKGVDTQREVVKEEKRLRVDNAPYGALGFGMAIDPHLFKEHPYKSSVIGTMEDLNSAELPEFEAFFKEFYAPNNAVLVVSGNFDTPQTKEWIQAYFGDIPKGKSVERVHVQEDEIQDAIKTTYHDENIQIPVKVFAYRTPGMHERDTYAINLISTLLTSGKSSRMQRKMVEEDKISLQVLAFNRTQEDYGVYIIGALPMGGYTLEDLAAEMDQQIEKIQNELISTEEYEKLQNSIENTFVDANSTHEGIANSLADFYTHYQGETERINKEIEIYKSITREEIRDAAVKYLNKNKRLDLDYLPGSEATTSKN